MLQISVDNKSHIYAVPGAMVSMSPFIEMETSLMHADKKKHGLFISLLKMFKRRISGNKFSLVSYKSTAFGEGEQNLLLAPDYPGEINYFDVDESSSLYCRKGSYLCNQGSIDISFQIVKYFMLGLFSKLGLVLQHLTGEGRVYFAGNGSIHKTTITDELIVDTKNLVAFSSSLNYEIFVPATKNQFLGGDGFFLIKLTGNGTAWIQTYDHEQLNEESMSAFKNEMRAELLLIRKIMKKNKLKK